MPENKHSADVSNSKEFTLEELVGFYRLFPEQTLDKTLAEYLSGLASLPKIRAHLGQWADQMMRRPVEEGVDEIGQRLAILVARNIAEGADLHESYRIKVGNRRSVRIRDVEVANQVFQRVHLGMTVKAACDVVAPMYHLAEERVRKIYYAHRKQIADELKL